MNSYKDLVVWQKAVELVGLVYAYTADFPPTEQFGLTAQMRRSSISIPSNLSEGSRRGTKKDFRNFVRFAYGSGSELETQLIIASKLSFGSEAKKIVTEEMLQEVMRMLNVFLHSLATKKREPTSLPTPNYQT